MMASRPSPLSPARRGARGSGPRVTAWTQHTPYPAAAGLHSEVGPTARSLQGTGQQQLTSDLASLHSLHHKELRRLHRQRKALQASMLAYAHKMREISSGRLLADSPTHPHNNNNSNSNSSNNNDPAAGPPHGDSSEEGWVQRRAGTRSSDSDTARETRFHSCEGDPVGDLPPSKTGHAEGKRTVQTRPRISVDSGIDVTEAWVEEEPEAQDKRHEQLPSLQAPSTKPPHRSRPASVHTTEGKTIQEEPEQTERNSVRKPRPASFDITETARLYTQRTKDVSSETARNASRKHRQRRAGTSDNPNVLFQKISMRNNRPGSHEVEDQEVLSSLPEAAGVFPSISPFPQFGDASDTEAAEEGKRGIPVVHKTRAQVPSPIPLSPSKLKKTKEQYWSLRKNKTERRVPARDPKSVSKRLGLPTSSFSPRRGTTLAGSRRARDKAGPSRNSFLRSFRYSDAVESLLKSFEDCKVENVDQRRVRQAAELLPTLDLEDLKQERTRLTQQRNRVTEGRKPASRGGFPVSLRNDDAHDDRGDDRDDDRSDYGSDDGSLDSFVSYQGHDVSDDEGRKTREPREETLSPDEVLSDADSEEGREGDGSKVPPARRAVHRVSFCLPPYYVDGPEVTG